MARPRGSPNKASAAKAAAIEASGLTPLDYMLSVLRDAKETRDVRMDAARSVAPYIHPKLATMEHKGPDNGPVQVVISGADKALL